MFHMPIGDVFSVKQLEDFMEGKGLEVNTLTNKHAEVTLYILI